MRLSWLTVLVLLLGVPGALRAQTLCELPHPLDRLSTLHGSVAFVAGDGPACDIDASLEAEGPGASGAFAWYSVPDRRSTFRISFRIDTSGLPTLSPIDGTEILAVTSRHGVPGFAGNALLRVGLVGVGEPGLVYLTYAARCGPAGGAVCSGGTIAAGVTGLVANGDRLAFEVSIGAGADGWARFWQNADFTDAPTAVVDNLDNAALSGPEDIALGAFNRFSALQPDGMALRFFQIQTFDDVVFWSGLDD